MSFKLRHFWFILVIAVFFSAWIVTSVSAHALLVRSNPAANAVLDTPPVQVELFFSEAVEGQLSSIRVVDSNNVAVDAGDVRVDPSDPTRVTVSLRSIPNGVYTVTWKAVSAVDGHQSVGSFPFAVGNANADAVNRIQQSTSFRLPFIALFSKFLMLASLALLIGQRLFTVLVWDAALHAQEKETALQPGRPGVWNTLNRTGLIAMLLAIGLGMLAQAGQITGSELGFPWDLEMGRLLMETRLGLIWLFRLALAMLSVWLANRREFSWREPAGFVVHLALLYTVTLTSHAATEAHPLLPILADAVHLLGMTFWFGGLVYFYTAVRHLGGMESQPRTRLTSLLTSRFSLNALIFVSFIGVTGLYSAYLRVGTIPGLLETLYGHVLLIKQGFVATLLAIAATNLLLVSPRLKRARLQETANIGLVERFGKLLILELAFAGLLLSSVSFLTYIPPAKITSPDQNLTGKTKIDDLTIQIDISPGKVGQNTFKLTVTTSTGEPLHTAKEVMLRFTPSQANIPPSALQLIGQGDGTFTAKGAYLSMPGKWQVQAVVRRQDTFDAFANFNFNLKSPGTANEATTLPGEAGLLMVCIGILFGLLSWHSVLKSTWRLAIGIPATLFLLGLGIFFMARPIPVRNEQANPIAPNSTSIAAGQELYTTRCAPCHGTSGQGDGPVGLTLNPRPADLTQHAIPGVHTDAQLFEWITNGFPGSQMPAFKSSLSDTDRWNLVNFIRTLAPR